MAMDIFNRPPSISEDTLQYELYPPPDAADKASVLGLAALVEGLASELLPDFIWHRDTFEVKPMPQNLSNFNAKGKERDGEGKEGWMLEGRMRVGDSVDDEWCVVWLLREASRRWDVAVTVYDSDGEFLLIEAADHLPSWVSPSNAQNRVWLYKGQLHLIPLSYSSPPSTRTKSSMRPSGQDSDGMDEFMEEDEEGWIMVEDALNALQSASNTNAPKAVEDVVWKRISGYPQAAIQHVHVTKAWIPVDIAKALSKQPSLVQKATETFYTRDAIQLRAAHKMFRFPPSTAVLSPVRMTRTAYAQLVGQKFHPPKIFGQFKERESTREWKWRDVGMKIACGFEMLYHESKSKSDVTDDPNSTGNAQKDALRRDGLYLQYIEKLKGSGYFRAEIEGSQLWNDLENRAAQVFVQSRRNDATRASFATLVNSAIAQAGENPTLPDLEEQSDDWLNVDAASFDDKLKATMQPKVLDGAENGMDVDENDEDKVATAQAERLQGFAKKVQNFVEGEGTLEGAVFDDENDSDSDSEKLSEFSEEEFPSDEEDDTPQIVEITDEAAQKERQEAMEKLVPALEAGEYGKMPASFYENSQSVAPTTMETDIIGSSGLPQSQFARLKDKESTTIDLASASSGPSRPIRRPILPRDDFDGVDSDDETDEEQDMAGDEHGDDIDGEDSDEDRPQVEGDFEIDMGAEEEEFLEFSRTALGISDTMWEEMMRERQGRGAFVPKSATAVKSSASKDTSHPSLPQPPSKSSASSKADEPRLRVPLPGPRPNVNPNLDSFEAVMEAMERELGKARQSNTPFVPPDISSTSTSTPTDPASSKGKGRGSENARGYDGKGKGKGKARAEVKFKLPPINEHTLHPSSISDEEDEDEDDIEAAMDAELRSALNLNSHSHSFANFGFDAGEDDDDDDDERGEGEGEGESEAPMDYAMIRNFLESFKSQAGLAGPVSSLAGRLEPGWALPRDESE